MPIAIALAKLSEWIKKPLEKYTTYRTTSEHANGSALWARSTTPKPNEKQQPLQFRYVAKASSYFSWCSLEI